MTIDRPMRVIIAPQAFKGSLTAAEVAEAIAAGIRDGWPWSVPPEIEQIPLADGGEGTAATLVTAAGEHGTLIPVMVRGPLPNQHISATLGWLDDETPTAVVEMAQAAGITLIPAERRDPTLTSTVGVGDLVRVALDRGARRIWVGLGGSGTNDGGAGMAQALGAQLLDANNRELPPGGAALMDLAHIDITHLDPRLRNTEIVGITDVINPLCGPEGASAIYGPQKGATPEHVAALDSALAQFARCIEHDLDRDIANIPGAGAAGGLGAGLLAFTDAHLAHGAEFLLDAVHLTERMANADLLITGEGRLDGQVAYGKLTGTIARHAKAQGIPAICVAGGVAEGYAQVYDLGITAVIVAADGPRSLDDAMTHAAQLIRDAVARAFRFWQALPRESI